MTSKSKAAARRRARIARAVKAQKSNDAALDAAVTDYLDNLWPKNPDGTPWENPDWYCPTTPEQHAFAENRRRNGLLNKNKSPFVCY